MRHVREKPKRNSGEWRRLSARLAGEIEGLGYEVVELRLATEASQKTLKISIDAPESETGVSIADCEKVSRRVGQLLDELDECDEEDARTVAGEAKRELPLVGRYFLEVGSPGIERPLNAPKDYRRFVGRRAVINLKGEKKGKKVKGTITAVDAEDCIHLLDAQGQERVFEPGQIGRGKLIADE